MVHMHLNIMIAHPGQNDEKQQICHDIKKCEVYV